MRKFDNIKPLHMESPLIREVPKYDLGTQSGGIKPITNPFNSNIASTRIPYATFKTKFPNITEDVYNTMNDTVVGDLMNTQNTSMPNPVDVQTSDPLQVNSMNYMKQAQQQYTSQMSSTSSAQLVQQSQNTAQQNAQAQQNTIAHDTKTQVTDSAPTYDKSKVSLDTNKNVTGSYKQQKTDIENDIAAQQAIINDPNASKEDKAAAQAQLEKQQGALKDLKVGHVADKMNQFGNAASILNSVMPEKTEYSGAKGDVTKGLDASYDAAADVASQFGPYGQMIGAGMKMVGFLNSGLNAIGGGTDGMTGIDATLGSSWGGLLTGGMSALNGFFGSTTDKFEIDQEVKADLGDAYAGAYDNLGNAADKAGKKYGALSGSSYRAAQREIAAAKRKQALMTDVRDEAKDVKAASGYEGIGLRNTMALNGGYTSLRAAKQGMKLENLRFARKIQKGSKIKYIKYTGPYYSNPQSYTNTSDDVTLENIAEKLDDMQTSQEMLKLIDKITVNNPEYIDQDKVDILVNNKNIQQAFSILPEEEKELYIGTMLRQAQSESSPYTKGTISEEGAYIPDAEEVLKVNKDQARSLGYTDVSYPVVFGYNTSSTEFTPDENYQQALMYLNEANDDVNEESITPYKEAVNTGDFSNVPKEVVGNILKYLTKAKTAFSFKGLKFKEGGELVYTIRPLSLEEIQKFKEGGSMNVIPEGALHKNKHHMEDAEGLTKKGIPVVTEDNGGELVQQAEIEKNEIIFRLEVTEKLEELKKKAEETDSQEEKDKYALEAGKLLAYEIMHNTDDRTGLIDEV